MNQEFITKSKQETQKLGENFAQKILYAKIIALYGDLGSGKTTFIQGLARALGIKKKIISPTFIIMRSYALPLNQTNFPAFFYHVDLYRVTQSAHLQDLGIFDLIKYPTNLFAIEWPEKIHHLLPKNILTLNFKYLEKNQREITLSQ
jgi:tRNA threonylcarbamoyladenosine biosynthesis protein TsaE